MRRVICQQWEESERGWGTRPDKKAEKLNVFGSP